MHYLLVKPNSNQFLVSILDIPFDNNQISLKLYSLLI